jgi:hypothetical protein
MPKLEVSIGLSPSGELELRLADSRTIPLRTGEVATTLHRVLSGMAAQQAAIGLDGAPTRAQALHWQGHSLFPRPGCAFCRAESRGQDASIKRHSRRQEIRPDSRVDGVVIRRVLATAPQLRGKTFTDLSEEECGL